MDGKWIAIHAHALDVEGEQFHQRLEQAASGSPAGADQQKRTGEASRQIMVQNVRVRLPPYRIRRTLGQITLTERPPPLARPHH